MSNKVAIVTGANKGIGFAVVKGLCEKYEGVVYLTSRDITRGKQAREELKKLGLHPLYHQLDITDENSIENFREFIKNRHGKIDVLINNAAILFLKDAKEPKIYQAEECLKVNFFSLVNFCEAMLPLLADCAKIVNISSSSGHLSRIPSEELRKQISSPDLTLQELKHLMHSYVNDVKEYKDVDETWGESSYVVSKVGVNAYTFILHRRLKDRGILVNCVHPGYVMTDMTKGGGTITPEQGARTPLMLCLQISEGGQYFWHNGTVVPWDGPDPRHYIDGEA